MPTGERRDPFRAFNFQLEIDNIARGAFSECSGLTAEGDAVDYREGTDLQPNVRKLVGLRKYSNITLKRGLMGSDDLFQWMKGVRDGQPEPRQITITLLDEARRIVATWRIRNAQPKKWTGPTLAAKGGGEVAMEELSLVHEGIEYV